jgi:pSer/pThr/pTyr-binding forkhead associated (FHA) protein
MAGPWKLAVSRLHHPAHVHSLEQPFVLVGRAEGNGLLLPDPQVSRRHAYLQVLPDGVVCVDLDSRTGTHRGVGTHFDTESRVGYFWLARGDSVQVGPFTLDPALGPVSDLPSVPPAYDPLADQGARDEYLPPVAVAVSGARIELARWRLNTVVGLVGSSPWCSARIRHESVSAFHCSLVRTPVGVWVIDLLSRRGTFRNGERVDWARLDDGDQLQIGEFVFQFRFQHPRVSKVQSSRSSFRDEPELSTTPQLSFPGAPSDSFLLTLPGAIGNQSLPALSEQTMPGAPLLVAVMEQFAQMQQQMFEQFHRDMQAMAGLFLAMHDDQMSAIRREMDDLRKLAEEIHSLQQELKLRPAVPRLSGPTDPTVSDEVPGEDKVRTTPVEAPAQNGAPSKHVAAPAAPTDQPSPVGVVGPAFQPDDTAGPGSPDLAAAVGGVGRPAPSAVAPSAVAPSVVAPSVVAPSAVASMPGAAAGAGAPAAAASDAPAPGATKKETPPRPTPAAGQSGDDVHAWLTDRIAALTTEHQSRWQKLLKMILGK